MGSRISSTKDSSTEHTGFPYLFLDNILQTYDENILQLFTDEKGRLYLHRPFSSFDEIVFVEPVSDREVMVGVYIRSIRRFDQHRFIKRIGDSSFIWIYPYVDIDDILSRRHVIYKDALIIRNGCIHVNIPVKVSNPEIDTLWDFLSSGGVATRSVSF